MSQYFYDYTDNNFGVYEYCPICGNYLADADFDFQICHICGWDSETEE